MDDIYFSTTLRKLRKSAGLTQEQVARLLNISRSSYTYYETGKTEPTLSSLIKLSKVFSVDLEALIVPPEEQRAEMIKSDSSLSSHLYLSQDEILLLRYFRSLSEADQSDLLSSLP